MHSMDTIKGYLPYLGDKYVALEEEDNCGQSVPESGAESSILSTRLLSKIWLGLACFSLGVFVGVFLIPLLQEKHPLLTTPGVPRSVTDTVTYSLWKPDDRFAIQRPDNKSATGWETLKSRFVFIDNPIQKGLQPSWPQGAKRQHYSVAGFHQLHCIYVIYFAWNSLIKNGPSILEDEYPGSRGEYTIGGHFGHCVDMIRQALMCYADATLEPYLDHDGQAISDNGLASGWGTVHTCRDFDKLTEWVDSHDIGS